MSDTEKVISLIQSNQNRFFFLILHEAYCEQLGQVRHNKKKKLIPLKQYDRLSVKSNFHEKWLSVL